MACWDEQSEASGGKQVDFGDTSTEVLLKLDCGKQDQRSGGTQSLHQKREELLLGIRRSQMNPDPA